MSQLRNVHNQILVNLIHTNPYPSFEEMQKKMEDRPYLLAEYGKLNHVWCKAIYENPFDESAVIERGKIIYSTGGFSALQANFDIITYLWRGYGSNHLSNIFSKVTDQWKI
jgi:hypothetical protein